MSVADQGRARAGGRTIEAAVAGAGRALWQLLSPSARKVARWVGVDGDRTLRLEYPLDERSVVFDLGGYEGQWASDIFSMYCCTIHVFEPVPAFAARLRKRFCLNNRIQVHEYGLAEATKDIELSLSADASSAFRRGGATTRGHLVEAGEFIREHEIERIDLMKINIEGGEYDLLDHLIRTGLVRRIRDIQVQFHDFVENAESRMREIQSGLVRTHVPTYQYPFVWENWRLSSGEEQASHES